MNSMDSSSTDDNSTIASVPSADYGADYGGGGGGGDRLSSTSLLLSNNDNSIVGSSDVVEPQQPKEQD